MNSKVIKKIIEELLSDNVDSLGFNFWKLTCQRKLKKKLLFNKPPNSWKKVYFKSYPRLLKVNLEIPKSKGTKLFSIIKERKSGRNFKGKNLTLEYINKILYFSSGIRNFNKIKNNFDKSLRMYPSAGARYPLEIYPIILKSREVPLGIYHYNVKSNSIELLLEGNFRKKFSNEITDQNWIRRSGMIITITAVFPTTIVKFKERSWRYIFF